MSKKEQHAEVNFVPESYSEPVVTEEQTEVPLYESEAYGNPQPDAGVTTTVTKPVGLGGPVPIVAPKQTTIQLQPIIVPLAVVPYMTQDSEVLRTDGRKPSYYTSRETEMQSVAIDSAEELKARKRPKGRAAGRVMSLFVFLLSAVTVIGFILAKFNPEIGGKLNFANLNVIDLIANWSNGIAPADQVIAIMFIIAACFSALTCLISLIGLIGGRYLSILSVLCSALTLLPLVAVIIYEVVKKKFVAEAEISLIILVAVAAATLALAVLFAVIRSVKKGEVAQEPVESEI